ncbi:MULTISPECIES: phosphotriesterase family protein [unclassified Microbacterium]|uniref:phosphotriesterase family protein n=1 Tax=unclassified Microbacterium TaxID=2609290 RepID=UPI00203EBE7B|nr:hypothetical protein [Microbacterium sp. USTB-Y]
MTSQAGQTVQTVRGPVSARALGPTMPHEHIVSDMYRVNRQKASFMMDLYEAVNDLRSYKAAGGATIVDCTSGGLGRDPHKLLQASVESDVHIVMGSGWYREPFYEEDFNKLSVAVLTERLVDDIENGTDGIRPGVIGEIGADREWLSAVEERALRASARAHRRTGLGIILHGTRSKVGLWQLDVLEEEGVDLRRVAVSHCDGLDDVDYHEVLARRGAFVMYDRNGPLDIPQQEERVRNTVEMVRRGLADKLLLSHDVCWITDRERRGGPGYSYVLREMRGELIAAGVDAEIVERIVVDNPRRLLVGA